MPTYEQDSEELCTRMLAAMREHPACADGDAWGMLKAPGFKCDDLEPSLMQASVAFQKARTLFRIERGKEVG